MSKANSRRKNDLLKINRIKKKAIEDILKIIDLFYELNKPEANVTEWLRKPNEKFDGFTPADLIAAGKTEIVIDALQRLIDGMTL